jgi:hypothetical protein
MRGSPSTAAPPIDSAIDSATDAAAARAATRDRERRDDPHPARRSRKRAGRDPDACARRAERGAVEGNRGAPFCPLLGVTAPFDAQTLRELYPSREAYLAAFDQALDDALAAGSVLDADAAELREEAARIDLPSAR